MDGILPEFLTEANEILDTLDSELVVFENNPAEKATLASIFRGLHTIKGTCGFLGLTRLEAIAHAAESLLDGHRNGGIAPTPATMTALLLAVDVIRSIITGLQATGREPQGDDASLIAELAAMAAGHAPAVPAAEANLPGPVPALSPHAARPAQHDVSSPPDAAQPIRPAEPAGQTIRVNVAVLENLMTLVGELVLARNQILQTARLRGDETLDSPLQRLSQITSDLQEGVMKARMQPIGNAWNNLPRIVRDLAADLGKTIELKMLGAETELDRQVLERIKDPLTHMVRNSADHGLETPAERRAAGKPERGSITLNAFHEGGHIVIEISDDGRGLPVQRIRAKALSQGLATEAELNGMSDREIQSFIFRPGFSTAAAVTSVSGRGVGMDVVRTNVEQIGGALDLVSREGSGTRFIMKIPLTLAIVSSVIVASRGERFAVPQINVMELVQVSLGGSAPAKAEQGARPRIERIAQTPVLRLRDQLLPLVDLGALLCLEQGAPADTMDPASDTVCVLVAQAGPSQFGLIVDRVLGMEEVVVKPVSPLLRHIPVFGGNTILGDGTVIMILDPNGIARQTGVGTAKTATALAAAGTMDLQSSTSRTSLLVVRTGAAQFKAVPLSLVARLESIDASQIEYAGGQPMVQYRGALMPLVSAGESAHVISAPQQVVVFADSGRVLGLMVDEIVDIVVDRLDVELATKQPGMIGTAIVNGRATDIIDVSYWLKRASTDWFGKARQEGGAQRRILVVEDSAFFRSLILPPLAAEGYHVTAVENPVSALALCDAGQMFDLILSDIEMPGMTGFEFAHEVRAGRVWSALPMIALTSLSSATDVDRGRAAGFDAFISKFDKDVVLAAVAEAFAKRSRTSALEAVT